MFSNLPILIVEDEILIALSLAEAVAELKGDVLGPVSTVREALEVLDSKEIAGAILDANLLDRDITPVAMRLADTCIPFVMHTATGLPPEVAKRWPDLPVLPKPAPPLMVAQRLWIEMQGGGRRYGLRADSEKCHFREEQCSKVARLHPLHDPKQWPVFGRSTE